MTERVLIFDTTLRDGEQSPGASMTINDKMMLAQQLERLRVDVIEAGFPKSSDGDFESVRSIAEKVRSITIAGLAGPARMISTVAGRRCAMRRCRESTYSLPLPTFT